ncbi:MAG: cobaltochelatase subunit CobN [Bryobacteraceae bacterium]|nr:cobaltochelatase subunit CobN [Bryobacteraceae bacterium]MDW8377658.1 cobaltochelatase subunit CobN [Bryobacterales bacterium]
MYSTPYRLRVVRADGRLVNIVQKRAHLSFCFTGCCCGRVDRGYPPVPADTFKTEWLRRKLRNVVHLTRAGCLGPCVLANVVSLVFDARSIWFHSFAHDWQVHALYDYIEAMLKADRFLPPPPELAPFAFDYYDWQVRPHPPAEQAPAPAVNPTSLAFLTHADTDLLALSQARTLLPEGLQVVGISLMSVTDETVMQAWLQGKLSEAAAVLLRLHGPPERVPGFDLLASTCRQRGQRLAIVSGTGELDPQMVAASDVPFDVLAPLTAYLFQGGINNVAEAMKFLSDRILLTGYGYAPVQMTPEAGVYLPELEAATVEDWERQRDPSKPVAAILFYRAHLLSGNTAFISALTEALEQNGLEPLCVFTPSLRRSGEDMPLALRLVESRADVIISTLSFAYGDGQHGDRTEGVFERLDVPVIQAITAGMPESGWRVSARGLNPLETAINVALPELDGKIITVPISFKDRHPEHGAFFYSPNAERVARLAAIAARMVNLRRKPNPEKRIAFVLTNSSTKASQVGAAVGLDAPASLLRLLAALRARGYQIGSLPASSDDLMQALLARGCYDPEHPLDSAVAYRLAVNRYRNWYDALPDLVRRKMEKHWGAPGREGAACWREGDSYLFAALEFGHAIVALQPPRGYGMDPNAIYHTPDLPPTHHYAAFYRWLAMPQSQGGWGADAIVHVGKHGTLEWLPGKGVGVSELCFPDLLLEDLPLIYPFIINDPGEGSQAKRRTHAIIVDHLTPPMTRAQTYGILAELNQLVNEYYALEKLDPSKLPVVQRQIWSLIEEANLKADLDLRRMLAQDHGDHKHEWDEQLTPEGIPVTLSGMTGSEVAHLIQDIDGYLCELGLAQIRDGLHVLGEMPPLADMLQSLTRLPNGTTPSLPAGIASLFGFCWKSLLEDPGQRLQNAVVIQGQLCHSQAAVIETVESLALRLLSALEEEGFQTSRIPGIQQAVLGAVSADVSQVLEYVCAELVPKLEAVPEEVTQVLRALEGRYVPAGPSGAPTRGNAHLLPTGRNFYAIDPRVLPTPAAWEIGQQLARQTLDRYLREEGKFPEMVGLTIWGTSQMRTQGDDVAEALAFLGVRPHWNPFSRQIQGLEAIPLEQLGRPRIDVTLRISGFFRDAFPHLISLLDDAFAVVMELDEPLDQNFPRKHYLQSLHQAGDEPLEQAEAQARYRIFGSKPGAYGAGLLPLIENGNWKTTKDLADVFLTWGGYAYGRNVEGVEAREVFADRLRTIEIALHNQDNREHDIFDSDDYFQFHGGMVASVRALTGRQPKAYFGDSSQPNLARVRDLREEALRVYRSRVINPKWIQSIQRHGYKGGLELAATVDYIFGFDATAQIVPDFVWEGLAQHYALDQQMQDFLKQSNPWALDAIAARLLEAAQRGLWEKVSPQTLNELEKLRRQSADELELREEKGSAWR